MLVKALLRIVAASGLGLLLPAQTALGTHASAPHWRAWSQGEPVAIGGDPAPACTVFAFYTRPATVAAFRSDGSYLAGLQRRFADRGLTVVAVVAEAPKEPASAWEGCRIVVDHDGETTLGWLGVETNPWNVIVLDKRARVAFLGRIESGLVDAVEGVIAGRDGLEGEKMAFSVRLELPASFDDALAEGARAQLEAVLAHAPRDGLALGLLYLTHAMKSADAVAAAKVLEQALGRLAAEPRPLAAFADLALRGDPRAVGLARALTPHLQKCSAEAPTDVCLQLAYLRALVSGGDGREVGRQAMRMQKVVLAAADSCLDFVSILTRDGNPVVHGDLAARALAKAEALGAPPRLLTAARYGAAIRCNEDPPAAKALLNEYLGDTEARVSINNDCWYLMTELSTLGRYDWFAAGLAERMLEQRAGLDYFEFDTAALAMFLVGRFAEAVELQEAAIEKGGKGNPEYAERLRRYKAGADAAPR